MLIGVRAQSTTEWALPDSWLHRFRSEGGRILRTEPGECLTPELLSDYRSRAAAPSVAAPVEIVSSEACDPVLPRVAGRSFESGKRGKR